METNYHPLPYGGVAENSKTINNLRPTEHSIFNDLYNLNVFNFQGGYANTLENVRERAGWLCILENYRKRGKDVAWQVNGNNLPAMALYNSP